jgi:CubicO group peptidase (beta-lactamase class C family)
LGCLPFSTLVRAGNAAGGQACDYGQDFNGVDVLKKAVVALALVSLSDPSAAYEPSLGERIDAYVQPYIASQNFSGSILVAREGAIIYARASGFSDTGARTANTLQTRFHVASMSMQFTAAAVLRLIDAGKLHLDSAVSSVISDYPGGGGITIRDLLMQVSGIADINDLADYSDLLKSHQDAGSLVAKIQNVAPVHPPGGSYVREEHSAYNLLALIVERTTGRSFRDAVQRLVFAPLRMRDSGIDDDRELTAINLPAKGYAPRGVRQIEPAQAIHWSSKTGNGSAFSTVLDEQRWVRGVFGSRFLSQTSQALILNLSARAGYGWFKSQSVRFAEPLYHMNGRAPGFASAIVWLPREQLSVIVLSNIYASVTTDMGFDIAALTLDRPLRTLSILSTPLPPAALAGLEGKFKFGADFFRANATLTLVIDGPDVTLLWPNGDVSALIPVDANHFIDRGYWTPVEIVREPAGQVVSLKYDRFLGQREP